VKLRACVETSTGRHGFEGGGGMTLVHERSETEQYFAPHPLYFKVGEGRNEEKKIEGETERACDT